MLKLVLLTPNPTAADAIEQMIHEAGLFELVFKGSPVPPVAEVLHHLRAGNPDVLLIGLDEGRGLGNVLDQIKRGSFGGAVIGFKPDWDEAEQILYEKNGITALLREPFSPAGLEAAAYTALHKKRPITHEDLLVFLPAKAGGGCSTVVLNTAAALAETSAKTVALIEADRRSGVLSIMLNHKNKFGLAEALHNASELTPMEWNNYYIKVEGVDILLADPARRGSLPSWADYYKLLLFLQRQYNFLLFDMPEVINEATAEVVKSARGVFIVCTGELPSLRMASQRCSELEACEIPRENVHIVLNRWERGGLSIAAIEKLVERPVFITLPNDYRRVRDSILESRLVAPDSSFAEGCRIFARKLAGLPEAPPQSSGFGLLKKLGRVTG